MPVNDFNVLCHPIFFHKLILDLNLFLLEILFICFFSDHLKCGASFDNSYSNGVNVQWCFYSEDGLYSSSTTDAKLLK